MMFPVPQRVISATRGMGIADALACLLILMVLLAPNNPSQLTPGAFVSIPLEALLGAAVLLILPPQARTAAATLFGLALGVLALTKLLDMGFFAVLARPFNPALDWPLLGNAMSFLAGAIGPFAAIGCLAAAVVFGTVLIIVMTRSVQRLMRLVVRRNLAASRAIVALAVSWLICALLGTQIVPGTSVASISSVAYLQHRASLPSTDLQSQEEFTAHAEADPFANTPDGQLLTALRGKNVLLTFVESYGRSAIEDPEFAPHVGAVLDAGNRRLRADGFDSRSAFLTSSTAGGGSWLAHGTLLSGLWIDSQQRYDEFAASQRLTLTRAFHRAGWRTVGVMPGNDTPGKRASLLGYDRVYDAQDMGYRGPRFSWASMPDQYTLLRFERTEHATRTRQPVMAEITLVSSHAPWEPIPGSSTGQTSVTAPSSTAWPQRMILRKRS